MNVPREVARLTYSSVMFVLCCYVMDGTYTFDMGCSQNGDSSRPIDS
jgi:hypothetical protein